MSQVVWNRITHSRIVTDLRSLESHEPVQLWSSRGWNETCMAFAARPSAMSDHRNTCLLCRCEFSPDQSLLGMKCPLLVCSQACKVTDDIVSRLLSSNGTQCSPVQPDISSRNRFPRMHVLFRGQGLGESSSISLTPCRDCKLE